MNAKTKIVIATLAAVLLAGGYGAYRHFAGATQETKTTSSPDGREAVPVVLKQAQVRRFEESIRAQGNLEAKNFALVSPRVPGVLEKIFVREGDSVVAGETKLFQTDSVKLEQAAEIARQNQKVAGSSREEREAYCQQIDVDLRKAELDLKRYENLYNQKAVSQDAYEEKLASCEKLRAMGKHSKSLLDLATEEEHKAATALSMAEKDQLDALVLAPISGKVSRRIAEPGEMGSPGIPVIRIDDVTALEASAHLPGQYYDRVQPGITRLRIGSAGGRWGEYAISYKSPTVDTRLRTFEIKCAISGDGKRAVPGAMAEIQVILVQKESLGVPLEALQQRAGGKVVFTADGTVARMVPVETGLETDGWIEVTGGKLVKDASVVVKGQFLLNDRSAIVVQKGGD